MGGGEILDIDEGQIDDEKWLKEEDVGFSAYKHNRKNIKTKILKFNLRGFMQKLLIRSGNLTG